jgi:hypothetical protein
MHVIRLHGAWEYEPLASEATSGENASPGRTDMPADWEQLLGRGFRGRVRCTRRFHRPTGLAPGQRVWLAVDAANIAGPMSLNGRELAAPPGSGERRRFEIAERLEPANVLTLDLDFPGGALRAARLEIEA